eukprot:6215443-Prymnesium_polylepis.1
MARRAALTLLLALCGATALQLLPATRPRACTITMKGRAQGGGPAIAKKSIKRRKTDIRTET